ncbi:hypothetical protein BCR33DRAFT_155273 [Rhizoclosmatium globosum]|uniref:Uncharacterized protein n=1 Tax=Rhizoclosmatium globosum TaxID=329046 RepID=A0A1Y2CFS8_9FUNG|nr:hypothetical protein BCR33DRAFT_155273 [Rhizoclosmatium globosum]|eukprot:ORY45923.1 hypothetical protein BCR33DRAFT_155273 [Rhizoclosmatium globosum]
MPEPSSVVFKDYEPEKTYTKKVKITNTSCRVNTFKMRPLSIELATFFDVIAPPPGRMSAGMECEVVFNFRPPTGYNQDIIDGIVEFEAEVGGLFVVRLGCSSKTCKPRISSVGGPGIGTIKLEKSLTDKIKSENESHKRVCELTGESEILVNFGACVQGGQAQRNVEIHNDGAIESEVEIAKLDGSTDNSFYITNGSTPVKLAGYASLTLCLLFQPSKLSSATEAEDISSLAAFNIKFNRPGVNPITIKCQGEILKSPLRIDRSFLDFGISVVESVYREQVLVTNHSNVAIKYWIEIDGMTLRSQFNTANKSSRGIGNNDKNLDYGSDICTDGIDSDNGDNDYGQTRLNFFSEDDLGSGSVVNMSPEAVGGLNVPALQTRPNSNSLLLPAIGMGFGSTMGVMSRQVSYLTSDDQQFSIRPLKRTGRNPAAISKRSDNLEVEVQNMGELEIAPKLAVIQPFETSKIWFKIKPSRSGHILLKNGENPYSVFVRIKYMNQGVETPMPVSITGRVTTSDMSFSVPGKVGGN